MVGYFLNRPRITFCMYGYMIIHLFIYSITFIVTLTALKMLQQCETKSLKITYNF